MAKKKRKQIMVGVITAPVELTFDGHQGYLHMSIVDCDVNILEGKKQIGEVLGCMGGGVEFKVEGDDRTWFVSAIDLWKSFHGEYKEYLKDQTDTIEVRM